MELRDHLYELLDRKVLMFPRLIVIVPELAPRLT